MLVNRTLFNVTYLYPDKCPYYSPKSIDGVKPQNDRGRGCRVDNRNLFIDARTHHSHPTRSKVSAFASLISLNAKRSEHVPIR